MSREETTERPAQELETLSAEEKHLLRDYFLSYRFSQGDPALQGLFFEHFHRTEPELRISDATEAKLQKAAEKRMAKYVLGERNAGKTHTRYGVGAKAYGSSEKVGLGSKDVEINAELMLSTMKAILERQNTLRDLQITDDEIMQMTLNGMLDRDYEFLVTRGGRPREDAEKGPHSPNSDPYLSHVVHYILQGNETGSARFDTLFQSVRTFLPGPQEERSSRMLSKIIDVYNEHHPESEVSLDDFKGPAA